MDSNYGFARFLLFVLGAAGALGALAGVSLGLQELSPYGDWADAVAVAWPPLVGGIAVILGAAVALAQLETADNTREIKYLLMEALGAREARQGDAPRDRREVFRAASAGTHLNKPRSVGAARRPDSTGSQVKIHKDHAIWRDGSGTFFVGLQAFESLAEAEGAIDHGQIES
ncbi:MAG: hypothetical protein GYB53_22160 [Rhodobacteraceae bacterium]|nr:hypothetical protein [Paracoccaceae bacterium]MBR9823709.1 hypothetical protein [Paracoccaceae bacterium]